MERTGGDFSSGDSLQRGCESKTHFKTMVSYSCCHKLLELAFKEIALTSPSLCFALYICQGNFYTLADMPDIQLDKIVLHVSPSQVGESVLCPRTDELV